MPGKKKKKWIQVAKELSRKFYGMMPRSVKNIEIDWPKSLILIGLCPEVNYISDKFDGQLRQYFHEFEDPPIIMVGVPKQKDGDNLIIIKGKFKIKSDGIVG